MPSASPHVASSPPDPIPGRWGSAIFISHASSDNAAATEVKAWLHDQGHRSVFLDFDPEAGIPAGRSWEQELYRQLRACRALIVLCSPPSMASRWCFAEITHARALGKPVFPVRIAPCEVDPVLVDRQIIDLTQERAEAFRRLARGLELAGIDATSPFAWDASRPPYPGLFAFEEEDAAIYFGRDREIGAGLDLLHQARRFGAVRMVVVLGASGSGKSSLLRAGLLPRLRREPGQWLVVDPFRPGDEPLANLASALAQAFRQADPPRDWKQIHGELAEMAGPRLVELARDLRLGSGRRDATVLLVIDQLEELLAHPAPHPGSRFLALLRSALDASHSPLLVVATLRSDYLGWFQGHSALRDLEHRSLSLAPLPIEGLAEVIEKPAALAGVELEPGLVPAMLADVETDDAQPLLAFTLRELYERHGADRRLEVEAYRDRLGGLQGSVARAAEAVLASQRPSTVDDDDLRRAFLAMVRISEDGRYARRPVRWDALPRSVHPLLERFVRGRLLVSRGDAAKRTLEVAHEALFRAWDQLAAWLDEDREALRLRREFGQAAEVWEREGRAGEYLWRLGRLQRAVELRDAGRLVLGDAELVFLEASQQAEQRARRRRTRRRRAVVATALLVAAAMTVAFLVTRAARDAARTRLMATQARGNQDDRLDLALLLSLEVERRGDAFEARRLLFEGLEASPFLETLLHGHDDDVLAVTWSPDGSLLASGGRDSTILLWDAVERRLAGPPPADFGGAVWSLAWSPDGRTLAAGGEGGALKLWDAHDLQAPPRTLGAVTVYAVAWSPDGRTLAAARSDFDVELWDVATLRPSGPALSGASDLLSAVAWSPDGRVVAAAGMDKVVRRWDAVTGEPLELLRDHTEGVKSLAWSPDGRNLASGSLDGTFRIRSLEAGEAQGWPLDSWMVPVGSVAWSGDSGTLAVAGIDGRIVQWDIARQRPRAWSGSGQTAALNSIAWSPDGRTLASGNGRAVALWRTGDGPRLGRRVELGASEVKRVAMSRDGTMLAAQAVDPISQELTLRLWDAASGELRASVKSLSGRTAALAWSTDGRFLATANQDGDLRRWDVATRQTTHERHLGAGRLARAAWSAGGARLAATDGAGVRIWDAATGEPLATPWAEHELRVRQLAWSTDGRVLAVGEADGTVRLWDAETGRPRRSLAAADDGAVTALAWSADDRRLAVGHRDPVIRLWDAASGRRPEVLPGHPSGVTTHHLAWSADGRVLASASRRRILLWDVDREASFAGPLAGHADEITGLVFSPDGGTLLSISLDGTLMRWDVDPESWRERACRVAHRNLTPEEWRRFVSGSSYRETCPLR